MGNCGASSLPKNKKFSIMSYTKLDKKIILIYYYYKDLISKEQILNFFPNLNFDIIDEEKKNIVKNRHFFKWYDMSLNQTNNLYINFTVNDILKMMQDEKDKKINNNLNNNKNNNNNLNDIYSEISDISNFGFQNKTSQDISLCEQGLRNYFVKDPIHFENRVLKGPPSVFRWLSWILLSGIPIYRPYVYFKNILSYQLDKNIEDKIYNELNQFNIINNNNNENNNNNNNIYLNSNIKQNLFNISKCLLILDKKILFNSQILQILHFILHTFNNNEIDTFYFSMSLFSKTFGFKFGIRGFFIENSPLTQICLKIFENKLQKYFLLFFEHITSINLNYNNWIGKWIPNLYSSLFHEQILLRIWDCFFVIGIPFLISFGLSIVEFIQSEIFDMKNDDQFESLINKKFNDNEFDIEKIIENSIKKYNVNEEEIEEEIKINFPNYNKDVIYEYKLKNCNKKNIKNNNKIDYSSSIDEGKNYNVQINNKNNNNNNNNNDNNNNNEYNDINMDDFVENKFIQTKNINDSFEDFYPEDENFHDDENHKIQRISEEKNISENE